MVQVGVDELFSAPAVAAWPDASANWASGIEVLIASNLSWWAYTGAMVRNGPSARKSLWPVVIGLGLGVGVGSLTGFYAGLALPDSGGDPTQFLVEIGGPVVGVIALAFIVLANIGTAIVGVYASTLAVRQLPGVRQWSWRASTLVAVLPAFVLVGFFADDVFSHFSTFLAFLGVCFGPVCGIQIVDYFLLRRQRYDVPALYDDRPGTAYRYWGGFNPVGFVAFAAGVVTYIYLLDPVTYVYRAPFQYLTASVPAIVVAGLVYWLGAVLVLRPLGRGDYGRGAVPAGARGRS
jgi:NCS1 family nucleobase:cation symporter-1